MDKPDPSIITRENVKMRANRHKGAGGRYRIAYYYGFQQFDTGSPKALVGMIDLLDRSVFEPVFIATGQGPLLDALRLRNVEIVNDRVSVVSLRRVIRAIPQVSRWATKLRELNIDLVHVNSFGADLDLVLGAWWARVPVVLHLHNPETISFKNLHRFAATRVLLVSEGQKRDVVGFERIRRKSEVLHNPIDLEVFRPRMERPDRRSDDVVIVTVAQISHRKGIDIVLDTARTLVPRHERLVFRIVGRAGIGEEEYAQRMTDDALNPIFDGRVKFIGARSDIPSVLREADLFFFPTRSEPFGIALIEAMATGLPVVATRTGGIDDILSLPGCGIGIDPNSPASAYAEAIESVIDLPDRGYAIGQRARASLIGRFDRDTIGAQLHRIYERVLAIRQPAK